MISYFKQKLRQLKKDAENGVELNAEQMDSLTKLGELENQIEFIKELQALTEKQLKNYQKAVRRRDYQVIYYIHILTLKCFHLIKYPHF
jgi:hypothetical protein